jgi:spermidine synthase
MYVLQAKGIANIFLCVLVVLAVQPFFEALHRAVRVGGIVCTQAESLWLHMDVITSLAGMCKQVSFTAQQAQVTSWRVHTLLA